jgi:hypothetical protein
MKSLMDTLMKVLNRGYNSYDIFNDWLDLMLYALQREDERYLEIVRRYKNTAKQGEREIDYFAQTFAELQLEMMRTNEDILGQVYIEWNQSNKYRGQYFTPKHVASMMAKCLNPKGRILDPCCGSGVMLVEAIKTMDNETLGQSLICGQDIDLTCVKMCALNLVFFNANGYVVWGDSLLMECNKVYQTKRSYLGGSIRELTGDALEGFKRSYTASLEKTRAEYQSKDLTPQDIQKLTAAGEQLTFF